MADKKPMPLDDDDWMEERKPVLPTAEETAERERKILAFFAEQERKKRENLFHEYKMPLTAEQFKNLDHNLRWELRKMTNDWHCATRTQKPTEAEMLAAALGTAPCPACQDKTTLVGVSYGKDTGYREKNEYIHCWCRPYRLVQKEFDLLVGKRYRAMDFRTATPSSLCRLPLEQQQANWDEARAHIGCNFLLAGSAGSGKTTLCSMLAREAIWRDLDKRTGIEYSPNPVRWVWVVDAEELFLQFADWATSRTSENPAPEPVVSPRKIQKARSVGCTPTLVLEELDKGRLTEPRFTFLFNVMNAMAKEEGQLIITTNRRLDRFVALFTESESETIRTSGEPLVRRFLENNCVKQTSFV